MIYDKHIFVCTNQRAPGSAKRSCGEATGLEIVDCIKRELKEKGITGKFRIQKSGCLDVCDHGPALVVYPQGTFYKTIDVKDIPELVQKEFVEDTRLERLVLDRK